MEDAARNLSQAPLSPECQKQLWASVTNFLQLQAAAALNIQGNAISGPIYGSRLNEESEIILTQLTKLNLYGCFTTDSQPYQRFTLFEDQNQDVIQRPFLMFWTRTALAASFLGRFLQLHPQALISVTHNGQMVPETYGVNNFTFAQHTNPTTNETNYLVAAHMVRPVNDPNAAWQENYNTTFTLHQNIYDVERASVQSVEPVSLFIVLSAEQSNRLFDDCLRSIIYAIGVEEGV
jgi:hypothetical protein